MAKHSLEERLALLKKLKNTTASDVKTAGPYRESRLRIPGYIAGNKDKR